MNTETKMSTITCDVCGETIEYEEVNNSVDCMPDGYFIPSEELERWAWICDDCGSCPECGASRVEPRKPRCEHQSHDKYGLRWGLMVADDQCPKCAETWEVHHNDDGSCINRVNNPELY